MAGPCPGPSRKRLEIWPSWGSKVSVPSGWLPGIGFSERAVVSGEGHQRAQESQTLPGGSTCMSWVSAFLLVLGQVVDIH